MMRCDVCIYTSVGSRARGSDNRQGTSAAKLETERGSTNRPVCVSNLRKIDSHSLKNPV